ncbi:DUF916 domain-containing protein [Microbacterium sp. BWT-B31]|uniref:WxL protein peptidoglycan domain-containing protein n=1 Tax=Microbacterium sp. BWT-B31 TaxID=3232072 RepID=UPI003529090C
MSSTRSSLATLTVLGFLAAAAALPSAAHAAADDDAGPQTWAVAPATADGPDGRPAFDYVVEPGDSADDAVAVRNLGERPLTVALYAQDAVQTPENAFEVLTEQDDAERIGAWVRLDATEVTVPARSNVVVPFTVTVPEGAEPGDHAGAIVAVSTPSEADSATVQYRVGTRIHLRVAGLVDAALDIDRIDGSYEGRWAPWATAPLDVVATLENTGNVRVEPAAHVRVTGLFGWWSAEAPVDGLDEILPEGAQSVVTEVGDVPPIGPLWVTVEITDVTSAGQDVTGITAITSATTVVWAVPWVLVVIIALLAVAMTVAIVNLRRRLRGADPVAASTHADAGAAPLL